MHRRTISTDSAPAALGPYSQAVEADGFLFCSGQIPIEPATGELVTESVGAATEQVLANLTAVLGAAGLTLEDVVKTTVYLTDMNDFAQMNEAYAKYFPDAPPARACVQVAGLPKGVPVEIEAVAVCQDDEFE